MVLERCKHYGLKLNPSKCVFFAEEAKWCGKMISSQGVRHCPDRVSGLVNMSLPKTGAELQQFLCAINWMRGNIPEYSALTAPLYALLEQAMRVADSRKKTKLHTIALADVG